MHSQKNTGLIGNFSQHGARGGGSSQYPKPQLFLEVNFNHPKKKKTKLCTKSPQFFSWMKGFLKGRGGESLYGKKSQIILLFFSNVFLSYWCYVILVSLQILTVNVTCSCFSGAEMLRSLTMPALTKASCTLTLTTLTQSSSSTLNVRQHWCLTASRSLGFRLRSLYCNQNFR